MPSIFTKIINNELPAYRIFENDKIISFLTIEPIQPGHTLVVPKTEIDHWMDVPESEYQEVYNQAKKIAQAIKLVTGSTRVAQAVVGLEVPHFHLHLIPMWEPSDLDFKKARQASKEDLILIQKKLTSALDN
jgi:histidine triad (HIT) family protein